MPNKKLNNTNTIFVDCFNTIIFRNTKKRNVFKQWAQELSDIFAIPYKTIYRLYVHTNFKLCFKKLFTTFTLQEQFNTVLEKMFYKLVKKYTWIELNEFIDTATNIYIQKEMESFKINNDFINFLKEEKTKGKKIYLVSDFYCPSNIFLKWFENFEIDKIFDKIFSSSDFNKEKATTKLYKQLINQLNLNPKNVIMYGDNLWSDVLMAKACDLQAKRIKTKH